MSELRPRRRFADGGLGQGDPGYGDAVNTYLAQGYPLDMAQAMVEATGPNQLAPYNQMTRPGQALGAPVPRALPAASTAPSPPRRSLEGATEVAVPEPWKHNLPPAAASPPVPVPVPATTPEPAYTSPAVGADGTTSSTQSSKQTGLFGNVQSPWMRALLAGGLGGLMGGGGGAAGMLGGGALAALLTLLMKNKPGQTGSTTMARGGPISHEKESSSMAQMGAPRARRFQTGGANLPTPTETPTPAQQAMLAQLMAASPGAVPPPAAAPPPGAMGPSPAATLQAMGGMPNSGATPGVPPAMPSPGLGAVGAGLPPQGGAGAPPAVPAALPQVAQPAAAIGANLPSANLNMLKQGLGVNRAYAKGGKVQLNPGQTMAKKRRPDAQWGDTDRDIENKVPAVIEAKKEGKAKGGVVRRPKGPKVSIAIVNKKEPVPTPSPYDDVPPAPRGLKKGGKWIDDAIKKPGGLHSDLGVPKGDKIPDKKIAAAAEKGGKLGQRARLAQTLKKMHKRKGGECKMSEGGKAPIKLAVGGVGKLRKGYPDTDKPKRMAEGGRVRGCGAATKGCNFAGIF